MSADSQHVISLRKGLPKEGPARGVGEGLSATIARNGPGGLQGITTGSEPRQESFLCKSDAVHTPIPFPVRSLIVISKYEASRRQGLAPRRCTSTVANTRRCSGSGSRTLIETATCRLVQGGGVLPAGSTGVVDAVVVDPVVDAEGALSGERSASTLAITSSATTAPTMTQVNRAGFNCVGTQTRQEA